MSKKKNNVDIAVVQTDIDWIKDKLTDIDRNVKSVQLCTAGHDNRLQKLEDWKVATEEIVNNEIKRKGISLSKLGLILGGLVVTINVILWIIERFIGI